jgi:hypothetical protein
MILKYFHTVAPLARRIDWCLVQRVVLFTIVLSMIVLVRMVASSFCLRGFCLIEGGVHRGIKSRNLKNMNIEMLFVNGSLLMGHSSTLSRALNK